MPYGLCNAPTTFQRYMLAIFQDMIEESIKVFIDDFSIFGDSFDKCLNNLDKMIQRCKDAHLVLNWEKCHFMVKEGIVLGHKVSSAGLEVDKAKIDSHPVRRALSSRLRLQHLKKVRVQRKDSDISSGIVLMKRCKFYGDYSQAWNGYSWECIVSTINLPILKKGEYDIWAMKMEHYLDHTDYPIWEVIQNRNGLVSITTDTSGQIKVLPPRTAEEIVARER
ncbi:reverse transcriptase domain-containing protein [Tanacetum coccineum]